MHTCECNVEMELRQREWWGALTELILERRTTYKDVAQ
jgi:hypothetical protein